MAESIAQWLDRLGLGQYAQGFAENSIDFDLLTDLSEDDFKELGLNIGERRRLQRAIHELFSSEADPGPATEPPARPETLAASHPDAERRQLTVLFCDLVGSTALAARLDPEDMRDLLRGYQEACAGVIARYDGYIAKFMGDGVYTYFGWPRAHEDDAERAINAGLGIVEAVKALERDLHVRIGIATGTVAVGDIVGAGASEEANVVGEAPNLAARLQAIAQPDTVVISASTHALVTGLFETLDLGPQALKGFDSMIGAWSVMRPRHTESRFEATRGERLTELVGRDEEMEILMRRWSRAKAGEGQVVLISGEAGIGKSRLVHALRESIADEAAEVRLAQCSPHHINSALFPFYQQISQLMEVTPEDGNAERLSKLEKWIVAGGQSPERIAPLIGPALGIDTAQRYPALEVSASRQKELLLEGFIERLKRLATGRPVLFAIEDAHWIDPTSLELLGSQIEQCRGAASVLFVITYRPEFAAPWVGQPQTTLIAMNRLTPAQCIELARSVTIGGALPEDVMGQIAKRTDGVPLFVEELTKSIVEAGAEAGRYDAMVPYSLQETLGARLDRLGEVRELAQIGATIGRSFGYRLLSRVSRMPDDALGRSLDRLIDSGLVFAHGTPPEATYTFKHALVQDSAYGAMLRRRRIELHERIAEELEAHFPETVANDAELVAHHWAEAGYVEKAVAYTLKASEISIGRANYSEGIAQLDNGLAIVATLPEGQLRDTLELDLQVAMSWAFRMLRAPAHPRNEEILQRGYELCKKVGSSKQLAQILFGLALMHTWRGDLKEAREEAQSVVEIADANTDRDQVVIAHSVLGQTLWHMAQNVEAREHFDRVDEIYDPQIDLGQPYTVGLFHTRDHAAHTRFCIGRPDQALAYAEKAMALARSVEHKQLIQLGLFHLMAVHMWRGEAEELIPLADEGIEISHEVGNPVVACAGNVLKTWGQAQLGRISDGSARMAEALDQWEEIGFGVWTPAFVAQLAELHLMEGHVEEALGRVNDSLARIAESGERQFESILLSLRGDALLAAGSAPDAETCYQKGIDVARAQSAKAWELRAVTRLAHLWNSQGKPRQARDLLAPVYGWFTEGFDTADLKDAKSLLDRLS